MLSINQVVLNKNVDELALQYNIVNLIQQLGEEEKKVDAQLALMEYEIDAENETEIDTYRDFEIGTIKTDKLKMEAKTESLTNKLQKHEKHLPDIIELEVQEALLIYQACLPDMSLESDRIKELIQQYEIFNENVLPEEFLKRYKSI